MKALILAIVAVFTALCSLNSSPDLKTEFERKGDISGCAETVTFGELPDFYADDKGDFTVLQFTDTHFTTMTSLSDLFLLEKMKAQTEKYSPDLVVMTGDMIDDGNECKFNKAYVLRTVAEAFEEMEQYWAYVPGNNDGVNYGTSEDVVAYLSQYEHCLVADEKDISGGCQYSLDIYDENELAHSMLFIDTMAYDNDDPDHIYGYVLPDQVAWCEDEINSKKAENDDVYVSVFLHENTPDFFRAAEKGKSYKWYYPQVTVQLPQYDIPKNQPLDDVFRESGCVGLLSMGHKHPAAAECSFYDGIYYHVTPQTVLASTLITIHTDADNTYEMYDFESVYM